jgi:hypothetical protein
VHRLGKALGPTLTVFALSGATAELKEGLNGNLQDVSRQRCPLAAWLLALVAARMACVPSRPPWIGASLNGVPPAELDPLKSLSKRPDQARSYPPGGRPLTAGEPPAHVCQGTDNDGSREKCL